MSILLKLAFLNIEHQVLGIHLMSLCFCYHIIGFGFDFVMSLLLFSWILSYSFFQFLILDSQLIFILSFLMYKFEVVFRLFILDTWCLVIT